MSESFVPQSRTETATCADCPATFHRLARVSNKATRCRPCRWKHKAAIRKAANQRRTEKQRAERREQYLRHVAKVGRPERSPATAKELTKLRREQLKAGMVKKACPCGERFVSRPGRNTPELCVNCALKGLPPLDVRWGGEHPLTRNV